MRNTTAKRTKMLDLAELLHKNIIVMGGAAYSFTLRRKHPKQAGTFFRQHILFLWTYYLGSQIIIIFFVMIIS